MAHNQFPQTLFRIADPANRDDKRFRFAQSRVRFDFDLYDMFNSNWPFTVNNTFANTATAVSLRPTNVLQSRFFKVGVQFDF